MIIFELIIYEITFIGIMSYINIKCNNINVKKRKLNNLKIKKTINNYRRL